MLTDLMYAAAYSLVGMVMLLVGFVALDLLTPGHLARHIWTERSVNAAIVLSGGTLGLGAIVFTAIWTNGESGFGSALGATVVFGLLGVALQSAMFAVIDLLTPGRHGSVVTERTFHPASLVTAAAQLAVAAIVVASIA